MFVKLPHFMLDHLKNGASFSPADRYFRRLFRFVSLSAAGGEILRQLRRQLAESRSRPVQVDRADGPGQGEQRNVHVFGRGCLAGKQSPPFARQFCGRFRDTHTGGAVLFGWHSHRWEIFGAVRRNRVESETSLGKRVLRRYFVGLNDQRNFIKKFSFFVQ